ncbi:MAG: hypothetical protein AAB975_02505 [Patescibacteria group bacterium]
MAKPQLLYSAFDTGPSNYGLDIISEAQCRKNWGVCYVGNNPELDDGLAFKFRADYYIVGGPSAFDNRFDKVILAVSTIGNKPVYVLGDTPRSILRPGVRGHVGHAVAIVALPSDIPLAKKFGYKDAVWLGYPSHWGIDPDNMRPSNIFGSGDGPDSTKRIFVCGLKHAEITDNMLASVIHGMDQLGGDWYIYFQSHPSEIESTKNTERRARVLAHPRVEEIKTRGRVASIMLAADLTVCTGGAKSVLVGALLRLPVIYYIDNQVMEYTKKQVNEEIWGPVAAGACEMTWASQMHVSLNRLLDEKNDGWRSLLRGRQELAFPEQSADLNVAHNVLEYMQDPVVYVPFAERQEK